MQEVRRKTKRVGIAIVGGVVVAIGVVAIPYPGPGWLIVFSGLAILATEFEWAQRLLDRVRGEYDKWQAWLKRQNMTVRLAVIAGTGLVVLATMWVLNVFGMVDYFLQLHQTWLHSPFNI